MSMSIGIRQRTPNFGFSAVELLVAFAVISILTAISAVAFISVRQTQELKVATQEVWLSLRSARNVTLSSDNDRAYGIHVDQGRIVRFVGPTYATSTLTNVISEFPARVIASTSFSGGGSDIVFMRLSGDASATGTINLTHTVSGATSSISVAKTGLTDTVQ